MLPKNLSVGFVEAEHTFIPGNLAARKSVWGILRVFRQLTIHDVHTAIRHGWPGVTSAHRNTPSEVQAIRGKSFNDAVLAPDAVALRPQPLWPIVGASHWGSEQQGGEMQREQASPQRQEIHSKQELSKQTMERQRSGNGG